MNIIRRTVFAGASIAVLSVGQAFAQVPPVPTAAPAPRQIVVRPVSPFPAAVPAPPILMPQILMPQIEMPPMPVVPVVAPVHPDLDELLAAAQVEWSPVAAQALAASAERAAQAIEGRSVALAAEYATMMRGEVVAMAAASAQAARATGIAVARAQTEQERAADRERRQYDAGRRALDRNQLPQALEAFASVVEGGGSRADGALYWKAYTLNRMGRRAESLEAVAELRKSHPQSRWLDAARALEVEVRQASGQPVSAEAQADEELVLLVIQNLLHTDPERAVPTIEKVLEGNQPPKVKERALFVLTQSRSPRAREVIATFAAGKSGTPDLQLQAIRYLGMTRQDASMQMLADIYRSTDDVEVKRTIIESFMLAGQRSRVVTVARSEPHVSLRSEAVQKLGLMKAHPELWDLYTRETDRELKKQIISALAIGGSSERLLELARNEKDPELRAAVIRQVGVFRSPSSAAVLTEIYASEKDTAVRKQVINSLFIQQNATALVDLARKETDHEMRKELVQRLSTMKSKEATDYMIEILKLK
jgi:hypothetical protein